MFTVIPPTSPASHSVRAGSTPRPFLSRPLFPQAAPYAISHIFMCLRYFRLFYITCFTLPEIESQQTNALTLLPKYARPSLVRTLRSRDMSKVTETINFC